VLRPTFSAPCSCFIIFHSGDSDADGSLSSKCCPVSGIPRRYATAPEGDICILDSLLGP
jgi:hypothetical protein